jgi:mannose-6-phosphate isomerase-like protein (cupin superfamily)
LRVPGRARRVRGNASLVFRAMANYTKVNLKEIEDQAPRGGLSPGLKAHFARVPLELEKSGISYYRVAPNFRIPFGHKHRDQEEVYLVVNGSARLKLDDEVIDLKPWDAVRVPVSVMRALEAGPEGAEVIAFGAPNTQNADVDMTPNWWSD